MYLSRGKGTLEKQISFWKDTRSLGRRDDRQFVSVCLGEVMASCVTKENLSYPRGGIYDIESFQEAV